MASEFQYAEGRRVRITNAQRQQIKALYQEIADEIAQATNELENRSNISAKMRREYLNDMLSDIEGKIGELNVQLEGVIQKNMLATSSAVVENNVDNLKKIGVDLKQAYFYVPKDIVEEVITGKVYKGKWTLSRAIWSDSTKTTQDLHMIVAKGIAENKSTYDIAKDLEKYVSPSAKKDWSWSKVYPGTRKVVDYNAQRLARTMVSHAYQESFVRVTKNNPFFEAYKWLLSNSDRVCPICRKRAREDNYGLGPGIYPKDKLPLDHPNGMCTFRPVRVKSYNEMSKELAAWAKGEGNATTNQAIDKFAKDLLQRKDSSKILKKNILSHTPNTVTDFVTKYGTSKYSQWNTWYSKMSAEQKEYAKLLKEQKGISWQKFYADYIYDGDKKLTIPKTTKTSDVPKWSKWLSKLNEQIQSKMLDMEDRMLSKINEAQREGLVRYTGNAYEEMNGYLRLRSVGLSHDDAMLKAGLSQSKYESMKNAQSAFSVLRLEEPLLLRRGTDLGDLAGLLPGNFRSNMLKVEKMDLSQLQEQFEGTIGTYAGFTSTSSQFEKGFEGDVEVIFYAPKNTRASSIMSISQFGTSEGETLLAPDTRVVIEKIEKSDGHKKSSIRIFMRILSDK